MRRVRCVCGMRCVGCVGCAQVELMAEGRRQSLPAFSLWPGEADAAPTPSVPTVSDMDSQGRSLRVLFWVPTAVYRQIDS